MLSIVLLFSPFQIGRDKFPGKTSIEFSRLLLTQTIDHRPIYVSKKRDECRRTCITRLGSPTARGVKLSSRLEQGGPGVQIQRFPSRNDPFSSTRPPATPPNPAQTGQKKEQREEKGINKFPLRRCVQPSVNQPLLTANFFTLTYRAPILPEYFVEGRICKSKQSINDLYVSSSSVLDARKGGGKNAKIILIFSTRSQFFNIRFNFKKKKKRTSSTAPRRKGGTRRSGKRHQRGKKEEGRKKPRPGWRCNHVIVSIYSSTSESAIPPPPSLQENEYIVDSDVS